MIIVTGASRGIGHAIACHLEAQGIPVFGIARHVEGLSFPAASCDVASYEALHAIARTLQKEGISPSGLINAAGIASMNLALMTPPKVSRALMETNLLGTIFSCQVFAPLLIRNKGGCIINFSSIAVALGLKGESVYAASKAGVEAFSRTFAREMAGFGVTVNCIAPGPIQTDMLRGLDVKQVSDVTAQQIIPRQYTTETICELVDLLLHAKSHSLSGQVLRPGGV